jgi:hypothetical protein
MSKKKTLKEQIGKTWGLSVGFYPGVLIGIRTYENEIVLENTENKEMIDCIQSNHVIYIPFIDIAIETYRLK